MIYVITKWNEISGESTDKVIATQERARLYVDEMNKHGDGFLYQMWSHKIE